MRDIIFQASGHGNERGTVAGRSLSVFEPLQNHQLVMTLRRSSVAPRPSFFYLNWENGAWSWGVQVHHVWVSVCVCVCVSDYSVHPAGLPLESPPLINSAGEIQGAAQRWREICRENNGAETNRGWLDEWVANWMRLSTLSVFVYVCVCVCGWVNASPPVCVCVWE